MVTANLVLVAMHRLNATLMHQLMRLAGKGLLRKQRHRLQALAPVMLLSGRAPNEIIATERPCASATRSCSSIPVMAGIWNVTISRMCRSAA